MNDFGDSSFKTKLARFSSRTFGRNDFKRFLPALIILVVVISALIMVKNFVQSATSNPSPASYSGDSRVDLKDARAKVALNRTFLFPISDDKGKEVTKLKFFLDSAEVRDEIILQGRKAVSVRGRTYLIFTIKLTNSTDKYINIKVRDFARLNVNNKKDEWLAAEIYNDPVEIQPQSTKLTRLGFPINDTDKDLVIRIGELEGKKETIALKLSY